MSEAHDPHTPLSDVFRNGDLVCSIEEAALHLARQEYPDLEPRAWLERIQEFAEQAVPMLSPEPDEAEIVGVLNDVLFRDLGFQGNSGDYYNPRNSFLNDVIETRRGIPITLSVLYMGVAKRVGLDIQGTAFPGHFVLRVPRPEWPIVVDAFHSGRILSKEDCEGRAERLGITWNDAMLAEVPPRYILRRMLNNLKLIYFQKRDWERLYRTTQQIFVVTPDDHDEHFTLGVALAGLGRVPESVRELNAYLELRPNAPNRAEVAKMLKELSARLN
jgi:regulator of sirC expression with transglutaminase-like and TPR domain